MEKIAFAHGAKLKINAVNKYNKRQKLSRAMHVVVENFTYSMRFGVNGFFSPFLVIVCTVETASPNENRE